MYLCIMSLKCLWTLKTTMLLHQLFSNAQDFYCELVLNTFKSSCSLYDALITFAMYPSTSVDDNATDIGWNTQTTVNMNKYCTELHCIILRRQLEALIGTHTSRQAQRRAASYFFTTWCLLIAHGALDHMQYGDTTWWISMKIINTQYIIKEIQNGCQLATLNRTNPKM